ncbi:MAG TPA: hypothetical protein VE575_17275 [Acidimicrobiales bacterium]|nr:hypothetical protein [Acidimicrobiales bacterium]
MTETTTDVATAADAYLASLGETDATRRRELIERAWTPDGHFVDPLYEAEGHDALAELAAGVIAHYPGHTFRRTSGLDTHHDVLRFSWEMAGPDGEIVVTGSDVGRLAPDGRLQEITGFFGDVPPLDGSAGGVGDGG